MSNAQLSWRSLLSSYVSIHRKLHYWKPPAPFLSTPISKHLRNYCDRDRKLIFKLRKQKPSQPWHQDSNTTSKTTMGKKQNLKRGWYKYHPKHLQHVNAPQLETYSRKNRLDWLTRHTPALVRTKSSRLTGLHESYFQIVWTLLSITINERT